MTNLNNQINEELVVGIVENGMYEVSKIISEYKGKIEFQKR